MPSLTPITEAAETLQPLEDEEPYALYPSATTFPGATTYPGRYGLYLIGLTTATETLTPLTED